MSHAHILIAVYITTLTIPAIYTDVRLPPTITTTDPDPDHRRLFHESGRLTLPCEASGTPKPEYEWKKDGVVLSYVNEVRLSPSSGNLTFTDLGSEHEGYYQCFAHNAYGISISNVTQLVRPRVPATDIKLVEAEREIGKGLHIKCRRHSVGVPEPHFSWSTVENTVDKLPVPLTTTNRIQINEHGDLFITNVVKRDDLDGKLYKCNLRNPFLDLEQGGSYTRVITTEYGPLEEVAPTPLYYPTETVIALVGQKLTIKCLFAGNPTPTVHWDRVDGLLPSGRYNYKEFSTELVISKIKEEDEGTYKCWGSNKLNGKPTISDDVLINVNVQEKPVFMSPRKQPHDMNITEGHDVTFFCEAQAQPAATVQLLINGEKLDPNNPGPRRSVGPDGTTLTISNVYKNGPLGQSDLMVVQCNASNVHGYVFGSGYLNVLEQTKLVDIPVDVTINNERTDARLDCSATGDSSTPVTLNWWKDGARLYPEEDQRVTIEDNGSLFIDFQDMTLDEIKQKYAGTYECQATNDYKPIAKASAQLSVASVATNSTINTGSVVAASIGDLWWVFVVVALVLLFIILLLCCCVYYQRGKGRSYSVDEHERKHFNNPEKELLENGFKPYQQSPKPTPVKGSQMSLLTPTYGDDEDEDDDAWMEEYSGDFDPGKFEEDGSFIGLYDAEQQKRAAEKHDYP